MSYLSAILSTKPITITQRFLGSQISDCQFKDTDGVTVIASLYLDREGNMYELDMWKTDFSSLKEISTDLGRF